jgi:Kef-type K+ transport system membrane component KefB
VHGTSYTSLLAVTGIALAAPIAVSLVPVVRVPAVVLEIVLGILVGPSVLGWVHVDASVSVLGVIGLSFLLFLAGLELDLSSLRGRVGRILGAYALSGVLALGGGAVVASIPAFFVTSGLQFDAHALVSEPAAIVMVPALVVLFAVARGLPAVLYRGLGDARQVVTAGLLQATSLSVPVVAARIGTQLHTIDADTSAAIVAAGLLTVVVFPALALLVLSRGPVEPGPAP